MNYYKKIHVVCDLRCKQFVQFQLSRFAIRLVSRDRLTSRRPSRPALWPRLVKLHPLSQCQTYTLIKHIYCPCEHVTHNGLSIYTLYLLWKMRPSWRRGPRVRDSCRFDLHLRLLIIYKNFHFIALATKAKARH